MKLLQTFFTAIAATLILGTVATSANLPISNAVYRTAEAVVCTDGTKTLDEVEGLIKQHKHEIIGSFVYEGEKFVTLKGILEGMGAQTPEGVVSFKAYAAVTEEGLPVVFLLALRPGNCTTGVVRMPLGMFNRLHGLAVGQPA